MDETRVFKTYNMSLDPMDVDFLYDYAAAGYYEDIPAPMPRRRKAPAREIPAPRARSRVNEDTADEVEARPMSRAGQGISLLTMFGFALAAILLVLMLFSHIELTALSESAADCQTQIAALTEQQHKLQARYETLFSLSAVEEYATRELGMQKPGADQIVTVDACGGEDVAEIVRPKETGMFTLAFRGVMERLVAYFG